LVLCPEPAQLSVVISLMQPIAAVRTTARNNYASVSPRPTEKQRISSVLEPLPDATPSRRPYPPILICAPPFQNPNLPRVASCGVATHHQTLLLTEPFGIHCRACKNHVGATEQSINSHLQSKKLQRRDLRIQDNG
jgi:hypothetical protein